MSSERYFPADFIWGASSSAYQIEGAWCEGLKGPSIWDTFCHNGSHIALEQTGDVSCDHYHHFTEDIQLMHSLGIRAYRFSISWCRIFPNGDQNLNTQGLHFYDKLVDTLLYYGITPFITLYHWDLPQVLQNNGGWLNRKTAEAFALYAQFVCHHFSDRVSSFITINEPQIISKLGYCDGIHAPGLKCSLTDTLKVIHHLALAHGLAVSHMRAVAKKPVSIGFSSTGELCYPPYDDNETCTPEAITAARTLTFQITSNNWAFCHTIFCDAVIKGKYPDFDILKQTNATESFVQKSDMELISVPVDFLGINIYNGRCVDSSGYLKKEAGFPRTANKWPVTPEVMNWGIRFLYERYHHPILITENGVCCNDRIYLDGKVHDADRIDFLERYLGELKKAHHAGADIIGYFHWSLTDNFEWHHGYEDRFGLVYVDYRTNKRIPKDSAYWYKELISHTLLD